MRKAFVQEEAVKLEVLRLATQVAFADYSRDARGAEPGGTEIRVLHIKGAYKKMMKLLRK